MKTESFVTLEVGRKYLSREGKIITIKSDDNHSCFPFGGDNDESHTIEGRVWMSRESRRDLITRIVEPTTLTIQRWGVIWQIKGRLLTSIQTAGLPYIFKTRKNARRFAKCDLLRLKPVKVKCTYEVVE